MRPFKETISLDEARAIIDRAIVPIARVERVSLEHASGRVLAETITSSADVPPFARAAMDGYAVRAEDTAGASRATPRTLRCIEKVFTGQLAVQAVGPGQCIEIATGAPMPPGADAVVMVEETASDEDAVRIFAQATRSQNIGRQGADIQKGQAVLGSGTPLNASRVGALAALGLTDVSVFAKPRVAILSTGNEIVEPGQPLPPGHIYDINQFTLSSVIAAHGGVAVVYPTAPDSLEELTAAIAETSGEDLLVFSGGSSVGERDLIMDVLQTAGEVLFHGIAVKPGKPTVFGRIGARPVLGMPGYPTSCLSNAYMLLIPMLRRMARLPEYKPHTITLPLARRVVSTTGRHQFYTVRIQDGAAVPAFKASGDITSMSLADGFIEIPAQTDIVEAGEMVEVKLF